MAELECGDEVRSRHYPDHVGVVVQVATRSFADRPAGEALVRWRRHPYFAGQERWVELSLLQPQEADRG